MHIYILFSCDEWKSRESMRLEWAGTNKRKLKAFINKKINSADMVYGSEDISVSKQKKLFSEDFENNFENIDGNLGYGYLQIVENNSEV